MARHLLKHFLPTLHTGATTHMTEIISFAANSHSISFCIYRYWSSLHQKATFKDSFQVKGSLMTSPSMLNDRLNDRFISHSHCCQDSKTNMVGGSRVPNYAGNKNLKQRNKKISPKSSRKEFTIKEKIGDHDMSIKLTKMQSLLEKGKTIEIFIRHSEPESSKQGTNAPLTRIQKLLQDNLQGVTKIRLDFSNKVTTKLTIVPADNEDGEIKSDAEVKTGML